MEGVTVEDRFEVSAYEVVLLSARDEASLRGWLDAHGHDDAKVSAASAWPWLKAGGRLLVARRQSAALSGAAYELAGDALQVRWSAPTLEVPMGAGLLMARAGESVMMSALSLEGRVVVAGQRDVRVPTDVRVKQDAADEALVRLWTRAHRAHPGAWLTAYAGALPASDASLSEALGAPSGASALTLTRLTARPTRASLRRALKLVGAPPLRGGYGAPRGARGKLVDEAPEAAQRGFRVRLLALRPWDAAVTCSEPARGRWALDREVGLEPASGH